MSPSRLPPHILREAELLTTEQLAALMDAIQGKSMLITGPGGCGKSRLVHAIRKGIPHVFISASTGIAGAHIQGRTIDSIMRFSPTSDLFDHSQLPHNVMEELRHMKSLVLDEGSMLRVDKLEALNARLQHIKGNKQPFGGVQLILIFDMMQINPVVNAKSLDGQSFLEKYEHRRFFFEASCFDMGMFACHVLTQNLRNTDPEQTFQLNRFRMGTELSTVVEYINDTCVHLPSHVHAAPSSILLCRTNAQVDAYNSQSYDAIRTAPIRYHGRFKGNYPQTPESLPVPLVVDLKLGSIVMTLVNNVADGYVNGDVGEIVSLNEKQVTIRLFNGRTVQVKPNVWEQLCPRRGNVSGTYEQFPLRLAYAFTAHKSQGMTIAGPMTIDLEGHNDFGTTFVMFSRATQLRNIHLKKRLTEADIRVSEDCKAFTEKVISLALSSS